MELGVDHHVMNIIEHDYPNDCEACCSKMMCEWLDNNPTTSWEDLIVAIDNLLPYGMY